jgi:hypothetical protein
MKSTPQLVATLEKKIFGKKIMLARVEEVRYYISNEHVRLD